MNDVLGAKAPGWFRIVAVLALLWNCFGVWQYLSFVGTVPMMKEPSAVELELIAGAPAWFAAAFAIGVFAGLLGCVGLILSKSWARPVLILSLIALLVQFTWWVFLSGAWERIGPSAAGMPAVIIAIAIILVWLANMGVRKGWLS